MAAEAGAPTLDGAKECLGVFHVMKCITFVFYLYAYHVGFSSARRLFLRFFVHPRFV